NARACSSFHSPGHPGVMRASGEGQVISTITNPAPPRARAPRCTRWNSPGTPFSQEYIAIGETTMRFFSVVPRTRYGVSMGRGAVALCGSGLAADDGFCSRDATEVSGATLFDGPGAPTTEAVGALPVDTSASLRTDASRS